jgi:hypothetical protein
MTGLPEDDGGIRRAVDTFARAEQLEQDSWDRTAGTGQTGQERQARTGHLGQTI